MDDIRDREGKAISIGTMVQLYARGENPCGVVEVTGFTEGGADGGMCIEMDKRAYAEASGLELGMGKARWLASYTRALETCPRCEKGQIMPGDYLCQECRYGS